MVSMPDDMLSRLPEYVNPRIFDRGLDYYRNDLIEPPERVSEHKWVTRALGRRVYSVSLAFNPDGDDEWHCDCPYDGPVCKHVVAACFAVLRVAGEKYPGVTCAEGLKKADASDDRSISLEADWSRSITWHKLLYEIARYENSTADMRTWLEKLIFDDYHHMKWFGEYKKTWPEAEWPQARDEIIARQKKRKCDFYIDRFLADIYVEEKLFDRLEEMLTARARNPDDFNSICIYAPKMADKRPDGAGNVMQQAIEAYAAENVGRKYYRGIARQLRGMIKWRGGRERARRIVRILIEEYPTRWAMKEELEQVFSDHVRFM